MLGFLLTLLLPYTVLSIPTQHPFTLTPAAPLPVSNATKSLWINTPGANLLANEGSTGILTENADVCIIGSGMTGVSTAFHLAQAVKEQSLYNSSSNLTAVILEAREFCSGATGRNGGHLTPYSFFNYRTFERKHGKIEAVKSLQLENRTAMAMVKLIHEHNLTSTVDLVEGGHISLIGSPQEYESLIAEYHAARQAGLDVGDVEWLSATKVESTYHSRYPAVKFPAFNFWPLKFVTQLYLLANSSTPHFSLKLHTQTPVTSIDSSSSSKQNIQTPRGSVQCTHVVHATNAYASHLLPQFGGRKGIVPTRGQIIALRAKIALNDTWKASWGGLDHYWFPRPLNGSDTDAGSQHPLVILGGGRGIGDPTFEQFQTDDSVVNAAVGVDLQMEWTGIMGYTESTDPIVGPVISDILPKDDVDSIQTFIAAGYSGHGMPRAFSCAEAVASMVVAAVQRKPWSLPEWFPKRYLTWNRLR
ncbi:hypothetical protein D9757_007696 [Collybiopsis confluens]|uniref:FAD dependent oxidoreductase domain-containing protein n=1 Tax=Collybiopsis confluens TaxID=2823264 RepID=A0A8H5M160_9AGAR|nr:hypothetical protein D9757_007696 [Collybiopsis confluens]